MLKVSRKELLSKLENAARVAPSRSPKEILRWVRLTHDGQTLTITATDSEVGLRQTMACEGTPCDFLLPADGAVAQLKAMASEDVEIAPQDNGVLVSGRGERRRFPLMDPEGMPTWEHSGETVTLPAGFGQAVGSVKFAIDDQATNYAFTGVYLDLRSGHVVCCNKRTLGAVKLCDGGVELDGILQAKFAEVAARTLAGDIKASVGHSTIELSDGNNLVFGRLVAAKFPKWESVIPTKAETELDISVGELMRVTRQAMLAADVEKSGMEITLKDGRLSASCGSQVKGDCSVEIPIASDADLSTLVYPQFVVEMLAGLDPLDVLRWKFNSEAAHLFSVKNWRGIIMPLSKD